MSPSAVCASPPSSAFLTPGTCLLGPGSSLRTKQDFSLKCAFLPSLLRVGALGGWGQLQRSRTLGPRAATTRPGRQGEAGLSRLVGVCRTVPTGAWRALPQPRHLDRDVVLAVLELVLPTRRVSSQLSAGASPTEASCPRTDPPRNRQLVHRCRAEGAPAGGPVLQGGQGVGVGGA